METKVCTKCLNDKPIENFPIVFGKKRKDGTKKQRIHSQCKDCRYSIYKNWLLDKPDYYKEKKIEWDNKNKAHTAKYKKEYVANNKDKTRQWKKEWNDKNKEWVSEYRKIRYPRMKSGIKETNRKSSAKMRENLNDWYVICTISRKTKLKASVIRQYPELIETQRLIIKTKRLCKTSQS